MYTLFIMFFHYLFIEQKKQRLSEAKVGLDEAESLVCSIVQLYYLHTSRLCSLGENGMKNYELNLRRKDDCKRE